MSRELVYLFELDSVRKANDEIICGRKKLYETIVDEGKCVILTFNQLTDSKAFLCPITYQKNTFLMDYYMQLFKAGALKVSHYYSPVDKCIIRTPAQYIMSSLEKAIQSGSGSKFIFSSLPIAKDNTEALQTVLNAFKYCDLDLLKNIPGVDIADRDYILRYVKWMLDLSLLDIGNQEAVYVGRKQSGYWQFSDYMDILITAENPFSAEEKRKEDLQKALEIVKIVNESFEDNQTSSEGAQGCHKCNWDMCKCGRGSRQCNQNSGKDKRNARSNWLNNIDQIYKHPTAASKLAKEMVNLCYNFGVESSIDGISNPYCTDKNAFMMEFGKRIVVMADSIDSPQSSTGIELIELPDWEHAAHIAGEAETIIRKTQLKTANSRSAWRKLCWTGQWRKLGGACILYLLFLLIDFIAGIPELISDIGNLIDLTLMERVGATLWSLLGSFLSSIFSVTIVSLISSKISEWLSVPDITEIIQTIKEVCFDMCKLLLKGDKS